MITLKFCFFAYMKGFFCGGLFFLSASLMTGLSAQSQFSGWLASFNTIKIDNKISVRADLQIRSTDNITQLQGILLSSGLIFKCNTHLSVTAGYSFATNKKVINNISGYTPEQRIWQQLLYTHTLKSITISHRTRIEERFIEKTIIYNNHFKNDGSGYATRLRYFIRNMMPLQKEVIFTTGLFAVLQEEVMANIGNKAAVNGKFFDQNRLYIASGYRFSSKTDLEIGYMYQYVSKKGATFTNNHIIQLAGYLRL